MARKVIRIGEYEVLKNGEGEMMITLFCPESLLPSPPPEVPYHPFSIQKDGKSLKMLRDNGTEYEFVDFPQRHLDDVRKKEVLVVEVGPKGPLYGFPARCNKG